MTGRGDAAPMEFPDAEAVESVLDPVAVPEFARVSYQPETPTVADVPAATRAAVADLPLADLAAGDTVAVCLGSRGITDVATVASTVVDALRERDLEPVAVPAMGSHGGASAAGQRETLASLGLTPERLGCPVEADMGTVSLGESALGHEVYAARVAVEADGVLALNRVKPHTNFTGEVESGVSKMLAVGLGKQAGASAFHECAMAEGYEPTIRAAVDVVREELPLLGGVAVVENFDDETGRVEGLPAGDLPDAETALLEDAREWMPTLPFDDLDVLVVERMGKDVSGTGMDTNVLGRYRLLGAAEPDRPSIDRVVALALTPGTHGNASGVGLADVTTRRAATAIDLEATYTNVLTSGSLRRASLPVVMPTDELALRAALTSTGPYDAGTARVAWVRDTSHLSSFWVSEALAADAPPSVAVEERVRLTFDGDGRATFEAA